MHMGVASHVHYIYSDIVALLQTTMATHWDVHATENLIEIW
jgi:hypothetical protein